MPASSPMPAMLRLVGAPEGLADHLEAELDAVERVFEDQLDSDLPAVNRLCRFVERYRGKMLRPTLVLVSGLAVDSDVITAPEGPFPRREAAHVLSAVCEMIHMATLVHDDVLDDADLRRRGPTVNYLEGNEAAVLLGDYLISNAFHLCSTLGRPEINRRIGETTNILCAGELLQLHHRRVWSIDERTYFEIIERKTASLIGLCCELGAAQAGAEPDVVAALQIYGRRLGVAFQIQDDLLDLGGDEEVVGKSLGKDLEKGKLTLPLILFLSEAPASHRETMLRRLAEPPSPDRDRAVRALLEEAGSARAARSRAERLVTDARAALDAVPASPLRDLLDGMARAVVERAF